MNINFINKKTIVRVDFNVPLNERYEITDDTRITAALPTIRHILAAGGAVILLAHFDRPLKKLKADGSLDIEKFTLRHVVKHLSQLLGLTVQFSSNCIGEEAQKMAAEMPMGGVLLLENTRFHKGEEKGDEAFARELAALGDVYVNDAFGAAHRAHASTSVMAQYFPKEAKCFGFLMESELKNAQRVLNNPVRPLTAIVGGAKVSDKILLLERMIEQVDTLIIGGGMAYTFLKAMGGEIGNSLCENDKLDLAKNLYEKAQLKGVKLLLPQDSIIADRFSNDAQTKIVSSDAIPENWMGLDIAQKAISDFSTAILQSNTILWNGPMGVFEMESFASGTKQVALAVAEATKRGAFSLVGGGDSVAAVTQMGLADDVSFISTGGGAMLELLEGKQLPGVTAILA